MADKEELYLRQANPHRAWYVIHTYSGYENKVKANLERLMHSASMSEMIFNVVVPVENEIEMKDGKEKVVPRKGVTGFVGSEKHPIPLTAEEAERILSGSVGAEPKRRTKVNVGDTVRITSGAFEDYAGKITSIDMSSMGVKVDVDGKSLDVEIDQVELI